MTYVLAAAGTGGHVYPALAVAEELVAGGVDRRDVLFVGGDRLEARVVPEAGYRLARVEMRGRRRLTDPSNLALPGLLRRAVRSLRARYRETDAGVVAVFGGYIALPAGWAALREGIPVVLHEQNAVAGLANRIVHRWAHRSFVGFAAASRRLPGAEVVGVPLRRDLLTPVAPAAARRDYGLDSELPVVGILGGSLGAGSLNALAPELLRVGAGKLQLLHLCGMRNLEDTRRAAAGISGWRVVGFEDDMARFYAAVDLVVCRAGAGTIAELAATGTPAVVVPYPHGLGGHQEANAAELASAGGAVVVAEERISTVPDRVVALVGDAERLRRMGRAAGGLARLDAAQRVASAMREAVDG